jgi:hypothetical protein
MASILNISLLWLYDCVRDIVLKERITDPELIAATIEQRHNMPLIAEIVAYILNIQHQNQAESSKTAAQRAKKYAPEGKFSGVLTTSILPSRTSVFKLHIPRHMSIMTPEPAGPRKHQKLTDELRAQLMESGSCFYCRKPGHVALDCPVRKGKGKRSCRSRSRSPVRSPARSPSPPSRFHAEANMSD